MLSKISQNNYKQPKQRKLLGFLDCLNQLPFPCRLMLDALLKNLRIFPPPPFSDDVFSPHFHPEHTAHKITKFLSQPFFRYVAFSHILKLTIVKRNCEEGCRL